MERLSYEQRRVLKIVSKNPYATPRICRTGTRTFIALEKRGLIRVGTTLAAVVSPLASAEAIITDAGRQALSPSPREAT